MKSYVIKNKDHFPVASTFFEPQAVNYCRENEGCSYILLPFLMDEGDTINVIAGPIDKEYLPKHFDGKA
jgi:hypothetical protein